MPDKAPLPSSFETQLSEETARRVGGMASIASMQGNVTVDPGVHRHYRLSEVPVLTEDIPRL